MNLIGRVEPTHPVDLQSLAHFLASAQARGAATLPWVVRTVDDFQLVREALCLVGTLQRGSMTASADGSATVGLSESLDPILDLLRRAERSSRPVSDWLRTIVRGVVEVEARLADDPAQARDTAQEPLGIPRRVVLPSDLLYQLRAAAMPPERMFVVAGRKLDGHVQLGAAWDVTGDASAGHCHADPERLRQALLGMETAGTYLAMWAHSHPGTGPSATCPSGIDLGMDRAWLVDYSPYLFGAILVADGWVRLWGEAVAEGRATLDVVGAGVKVDREDDATMVVKLTRRV